MRMLWPRLETGNSSVTPYRSRPRWRRGRSGAVAHRVVSSVRTRFGACGPVGLLAVVVGGGHPVVAGVFEELLAAVLHHQGRRAQDEQQSGEDGDAGGPGSWGWGHQCPDPGGHV